MKRLAILLILVFLMIAGCSKEYSFEAGPATVQTPVVPVKTADSMLTAGWWKIAEVQIDTFLMPASGGEVFYMSELFTDEGTRCSINDSVRFQTDMVAKVNSNCFGSGYMSLTGTWNWLTAAKDSITFLTTNVVAGYTYAAGMPAAKVVELTDHRLVTYSHDSYTLSYYGNRHAYKKTTFTR